MVSISIGVYIFFYLVNVFSIMRYIQGTLTLKKTSIGQTIGVYMFTLIVGVLAGLLVTVESGEFSGLQVILMLFVYLGFMVSILIQLKDYVEQHSRKKMGLHQYNLAMGLYGMYKATLIMVIIGSILAVVGLWVKQILLVILGVTIVVVFFSSQLKQSTRVVLTATNLTAEEREEKITQFNEAVEENRLDELDNADKTVYKKSRRKLNKYLKKRG